MSFEAPPLKIVRIQVFQGGDRDSLLREVARAAGEKWSGISLRGSSLSASTGELECQFTVEEVRGLLTLTSIISYRHGCELRSLVERDLETLDLSGSVRLPQLTLLSTFTVFVSLSPTASPTTIERCSECLSRPSIGLGVARGCLLAIFEQEGGSELFNRYYVVSPLSREAVERVGEVVDCIRSIAIYTAELFKLYGDCRRFFTTLKPGEMEVNERIEEFLWELMIKPEPMELETLRSWLRYAMEKESITSALVSAMQEKYEEAKSVLARVEECFKRLNEKGFQGYPANSEIEVYRYREIVRPFENYLVRGEMLKARLRIVIDEIRTYLSLQQQKIALEEQRASKEQLTRLVSLQETFHKIEVFIVAVYIVEVARNIFEVLAHEKAGLLTALFIPVALLLAVTVSRLLHRSRKRGE